MIGSRAMHGFYFVQSTIQYPAAKTAVPPFGRNGRFCVLSGATINRCALSDRCRESLLINCKVVFF